MDNPSHSFVVKSAQMKKTENEQKMAGKGQSIFLLEHFLSRFSVEDFSSG